MTDGEPHFTKPFGTTFRNGRNGSPLTKTVGGASRRRPTRRSKIKKFASGAGMGSRTPLISLES